MNKEDKDFAEKALKQMFIGSTVDGIRFGVGPGSTFVCFTHYTNHPFDSLWLNIESRWGVYDSLADTMNFQDNMVEQSEEENFKAIFEIRRDEVMDIQLGDISPNLFITFTSGKMLVVDGYDENYECWQAGGELEEVGDWLVVAVPGNGIAVWSPGIREE
ncbi:hypothetical protein ACFDTO_36615 [Microbacteriaceae bacterium 4G12]